MGRLLDEDDVIDAVRNELKRNPTMAIRTMSAVRKLLSAQPTPNWIPCGESLPKKEGIYIVTDDAGGMATVSTDEFSHYEDNEPFWMFSQKVTAWMPLPEPYQEEGEQDG